MAAPTAQDYFAPTRSDDKAIAGGSRLIRHCRAPAQIVPCPRAGQKISSQAYKAKRGDLGASVDLEDSLIASGKTAIGQFGVMPNTYALLAITADVARQHSAGLAWTPKPAEPEKEGYAALPNPHHGEILTPITGAQARALTNHSEVLISKL